MNEQPWYGVRSLFYDKEQNTYEERTILVRAESDNDAIKTAEADAKAYAKDIGISYTGYSDSFHLFDKEINNLSEVFSIMRTTNLSQKEYINQYLDSGTERRKSD